MLRRIRRALAALNKGRISGDTFDRLIARHATIEHATRFYDPYRKADAARNPRAAAHEITRYLDSLTEDP
ncbi:hypothetical protein [Sphingopyxis sp. BE249]|uniref:hypothetical protein n=1 Tax=Sphingopyxis sp. BE249 TaxID=2817719 RepID=UPI00286AA6A7|nr:hypothetical protein [Sphingopyxis sp. BE249]